MQWEDEENRIEENRIEENERQEQREENIRRGKRREKSGGDYSREGPNTPLSGVCTCTSADS